MEILWGILIVVALLGIFILVYILNKKTPIPENCAKDSLPEGCGSCMMTCSGREKEFSPKNLLKGEKADEEVTHEEPLENKEEEKDD